MPRGRPPRNNMTEEEKLAELTGKKTVEKKERPKKEPTKVVFQLVGDFKRDQENGTIKYPPKVIINNEYPCYCDVKKEIRQARVLRGISTIWRDEQEKISDRYANENRVLFEFVNGKLIVPTIEKNHIKYLKLRADFKDCERPTKNVNPKYMLVDTYASESAAYEKRQKQLEAMALANEADYEDLIPHFKHLGGNIINQEGEEMSDEGLRAAYIRLAEEKTDLFLKTFDNPVVKMYGLVRKGFEQNLITYVDGQCSWGDTKTFICQIPEKYSMRVSDYLAELMLTQDGVELRSRLESIK
jgi:hypothetical protein